MAFALRRDGPFAALSADGWSAERDWPIKVRAIPRERVREFRGRLESALPDEREELMNEYVRSSGDGSAPNGRGPSPGPPASADGSGVGFADGRAIAQPRWNRGLDLTVRCPPR